MLPFALPDRYELTNLSFKGGQGTIVICIDRFLKRQVAIKVLEQTTNPDLLRQEIATMSGINSRHVAEVFDVITASDGSPLGLVEEYVAGAPLADYVVDSTVQKFLLTMWQIASGVADIHYHQKIHRDLNPANIRLDAEGVIKILDFGLSMDLHSAITIQRRGTHHYAAPELFGIPPVHLTAAADVYSLGVLAWFVAQSGSLPAFLCWSSGVRGVKPKSLAEVLPTLPPDLIRLLDNTLSDDSTLRPTSAAIRDRLERQILYGQHRVAITYKGSTKLLSRPNDSVRLTADNDSVSLRYDGLKFMVESTQGNVFVNNDTLKTGETLPDSCVITLGAPELGIRRMFVPVDMSHPGVEV